MFKFISTAIWSIVLVAALSFAAPAEAASGHGTRSSSRPQRPHAQSSQLSYNAYWKAATSPKAPNPNQNYNRYWAKVQARQEYQDRMKK